MDDWEGLRRKEKWRRKRKVILAEPEDIETGSETEDDEEKVNHYTLVIEGSRQLRRSSGEGPEKRVEAGDARSPSPELVEIESSE